MNEPLPGWKTHLVALLVVVVGMAQAYGVLSEDDATQLAQLIEPAVTTLMGLGLSMLRLGVAKGESK